MRHVNMLVQVPHQSCKSVPKSHQVPKEHCKKVPKQHCRQVPVQGKVKLVAGKVQRKICGGGGYGQGGGGHGHGSGSGYHG